MKADPIKEHLAIKGEGNAGDLAWFEWILQRDAKITMLLWWGSHIIKLCVNNQDVYTRVPPSIKGEYPDGYEMPLHFDVLPKGSRIWLQVMVHDAEALAARLDYEWVPVLN